MRKNESYGIISIMDYSSLSQLISAILIFIAAVSFGMNSRTLSKSDSIIITILIAIAIAIHSALQIYNRTSV